MHRNNGDAFLNNYGEQLIQFFIASKLKVLIIRTRRDVQGDFTFLGYQRFSFRNFFPNKLDTVPFSTNFCDYFRPWVSYGIIRL